MVKFKMSYITVANYLHFLASQQSCHHKIQALCFLLLFLTLGNLMQRKPCLSVCLHNCYKYMLP